MAIPTFVQKSRINQVIYQIRDGRLSISERALFGNFADREIDLRQLNPDYQPGITRNHTVLIIFLVLSALCGFAVWGGLRQTVIPVEAARYIVYMPAIGFATFLAAAVRWSRRIEYYLFKTRSGHPAVLIIREREQAEECAAFITSLVAHIEIAQTDLDPKDRTKLLRLAEVDHAFIPAPKPGLALWKLSIALGAMASGLPWLPNIHAYLFGCLFEIVFCCCVGGATLCAFSFSANEPKRWWSVVGFALSLVPPIFYQAG